MSDDAARLAWWPAAAACLLIHPPCCPEFIILADNDDAGQDAARDTACSLKKKFPGCIVRKATPIKPEGGKEGYDWNDALTGGANPVPDAILNAPIFDAKDDGGGGDEDEKYAARIEALSKLESRAYDAERQAIKKHFDVRASTIDDDIDKYRRELKVEAATPAEPDIKQLAASAKEIIECEDVLEKVAEVSSKVIAGEEPLIKLLYLGGTSRLFPKAMHIAVKGPSAGGKSEARRRTLEMFFPPEAVFSFTALSERALIYVKDDFPHKILSMGEAYNSEELKFQDYVLREMLSEGVVRYQVAQKQPDGTIETVTLEKHGPVAFMVTTTRNRLHHENETRMLSIEVDDSAEQTRRVIEKVAEVEGLNRDFASAEMKPWHDFQRWLAAGDCIVVVPFARVLSRLVKEAKAVRLRRDFGQLLRAIKAHALLHRQHRRRTKQGSIIAEIEQDYLPVRKLLADLLATAAEMKTRKTIAATVWAVKKLQLSDGASAREIAAKLKLDSSTAYRRLQAAVDAGLIENLEERPRRPGRYKVSGGEAGSTWILPLTPELREAYDAARMKPAQSSSSRTARRKT